MPVEPVPFERGRDELSLKRIGAHVRAIADRGALPVLLGGDQRPLT